MIVILDYGMGNLGSVEKAIRSLGADCKVSPNLQGADKLIIPGVGAFGAAMERLSTLKSEIVAFANGGAPLLGICLGQQLLFERSEEHGEHEGLGLVPGTVKYLPKLPGVKIPHIGWSPLHYRREASIATGSTEGEQVYFVHSLHTVCDEEADVLATANHGIPFAAIVLRGNIVGAQFHPGEEQYGGLEDVEEIRRMLILPAIDLRGGKCVRLSQGDYSRETVYGEDPLEVAAQFEAEGAEWIHVVDLDGARSGEPVNLLIVERIAARTKAKIEFGGGIRSLDVARRVLSAGVKRVVIGTKLISDPKFAEVAFRELGEEIVAGIDARHGMVATDGWLETSETTAVDLAKRAEAAGATRLVLTDIARDGMLTGPNLELLSQVLATVQIPVIQSGGVSSIADLLALARLGSHGPEGVIVGKAIYEGKFSVKQAMVALEPFVPQDLGHRR